MKGLLFIALVYILHCEGGVVIRYDESEELNERPIIGVLAQEQSLYLHTKFPKENYTSYIAASYVKDVESAGARVVPIMVLTQLAHDEIIVEKYNDVCQMTNWRTRFKVLLPQEAVCVYLKLMPASRLAEIDLIMKTLWQNLMGRVLIPGGATYFNQSNGYADAGQHIYEIAEKLNDAGDYFPIFGTCLGFELLIILASGRGKVENRIRCYSYDNLPLNFTNDFRESKMFKKAPEEVINILSHENVTVNAHQFCIDNENLESHNLTHDWHVTSYSDDKFGLKFIASIEHLRYPFYGVQFHPEKIAFEWKLSKHYPHGEKALKANRYFMDFFVKECKKSRHSFASAAEENQYLIYNYAPHFTGILGSAYHQCYLFEPRGTVSK